MEWRIIPGFPAYEVSRAGIVRNAVTKCHLGKNGRRYRLSAEGTRWNMHPYELVGMAFGDAEVDAPEPQSLEAHPSPAATGGETVPVPAAPDDGRIVELERENRELRAVVAELEAELQVYRVAI